MPYGSANRKTRSYQLTFMKQSKIVTISFDATENFVNWGD